MSRTLLLCDLPTESRRLHRATLQRPTRLRSPSPGLHDPPLLPINSDVRARVLDPAQQRRVEAFRPKDRPPRLFTLRYEGLSLEQYFNRLINNAVSVLCDVRRNAMSMKYGFSKRTLEQACEGVGVTYVHL